MEGCVCPRFLFFESPSDEPGPGMGREEGVFPRGRKWLYGSKSAIFGDLAKDGNRLPFEV
jgi:hypothetical protein